MIAVPIWRYKESKYIIKDMIYTNHANMIGPDDHYVSQIVLSCIDEEDGLTGKEVCINSAHFYEYAEKIGTAKVNLEM